MNENKTPQPLKAEHFEPHVGGSFQIHFDDASYGLDLDSMKRLENRGQERDPFALYFLGESDVCLRQAIYSLEHEVLGTHEIFIVPVGTQDGRYLYEAIFN